MPIISDITRVGHGQLILLIRINTCMVRQVDVHMTRKSPLLIISWKVQKDTKRVLGPYAQNKLDQV